jgi:outer membrane protein assembly factor BamB
MVRIGQILFNFALGDEVPKQGVGRAWRLPAAVVAVLGMTAGPALATGSDSPVGSGSCTGDWPMYQHDSAHTGAADACSTVDPSNVATLTPRWFVNTNEVPVTAAPIVVDNTLYVGDASGVFRSINATDGTVNWSTALTDSHNPSYGEIVDSAAYDSGTVYVGSGGTMFALDAANGAIKWRTDSDPVHPTNAAEIESSPVVVHLPGHTTEVVAGNDGNEDPTVDKTGVIAYNAATGAILWRFEPARYNGRPGSTGLAPDPSGTVSDPGWGCGDVWSSVAYDRVDHSLIFGSGNCSDPAGAKAAGTAVTTEAIWSIRADNGAYLWHAIQAPKELATYNEDDDFGSSPVLRYPTAGDPIVIEGNKSGYVYALDAKTGTIGSPGTWEAQVAQPGQSGPFAGAIGGFIGGAALGNAGSKLAFFGLTAIPLPLQGSGVDTNTGQIYPDQSLPADPTRAVAIHAVNAATGQVLWQSPFALPSYAPVSYTNGVLFGPSTTGFGMVAYNAADGTPLWALPTAASLSGGVVIDGSNVYFGAGTSENSSLFIPSQVPTQVPPQAMGIWSFGLPAVPTTPPALP